MKKILSMILALLMTVSIVGCQKDDQTEKTDDNGETAKTVEETLDIVIYDRGEDEAYWNGVIAAFEEANPGVKIEMTVSEDAAYELRDRILSGNSPDFVYLPSEEESGVTEALVKDHAMEPLPEVESAASSLMLNGAVDNNQCRPYDDGKMYLAPLFFETEGFIYNKTLMQENGWDIPTTWDELIALAEKCDEENISVLSYAGREPEQFVGIMAAALLSTEGTEQMNALLNCSEEAWKDNESMKAFMEKIEAIKMLVASGSSTKSLEDVRDDLTAGKVLFVSGTSDDLEDLAEDENYQYGFFLYPKLSPEGEKTAIVTFSEMFIPVEAKNKDLAKKFMIFQYSDAAAKIAAETLGELMPIQKIASLAGQYELEPSAKEVYLSFGTSVFSPKFVVKSAENATLSDEFTSLIVSVFKSEVASEEFSEKMIEYIQEFN